MGGGVGRRVVLHAGARTEGGNCRRGGADPLGPSATLFVQSDHDERRRPTCRALAFVFRNGNAQESHSPRGGHQQRERKKPNGAVPQVSRFQLARRFQP